MAMTKKEKALVEQLLTQSALRHTSPVEPDLAPPKSMSKGVIVGFLPVAERSEHPRVDHACSSAISHGLSHLPISVARSQKPKAIYSTKLMALRQLRYLVEQNSAERLRKIDQKIEKELAGE